MLKIFKLKLKNSIEKNIVKILTLSILAIIILAIVAILYGFYRLLNLFIPMFICLLVKFYHDIFFAKFYILDTTLQCILSDIYSL